MALKQVCVTFVISKCPFLTACESLVGLYMVVLKVICFSGSVLTVVELKSSRFKRMQAYTYLQVNSAQIFVLRISIILSYLWAPEDCKIQSFKIQLFLLPIHPTDGYRSMLYGKQNKFYIQLNSLGRQNELIL